MTARTEVDARQALTERLVDATTHALETLGVYLGLELGLYQALADLETATEAEVAGHADVAPRYAREWLEQQAVAGYLACDDPTRPPLPAALGHAEVLLDADSASTTPARSRGSSRASPGCCRGRWRPTAPAVASPYAAYGPQRAAAWHRRGQPADVPPRAGQQLATCHTGGGPAAAGRPHRPDCSTWAAASAPSSIALARAYPRAQVLGVDLDQASVTEARTWQPTRASPTASPSWSTSPTPPPRSRSTWSPFSRHCTTWATRWGRCGRPADCWPTTAAFWSPTNAWPTPSPPPAT